MRVDRYAAKLLADYPNALRIRRRGLRMGLPEAFRRGTGRPVVILPGVYETWHFLAAAALRLNEAGHPVHVLPELGINAAPIPQTIGTVVDAVNRRDLRDVALVAHSKGGLVGKGAMLQDAQRRIDRLVAIATPFGGSRMANLTLLPSLRTFSPRHRVILGLGAERAINARITSIYPSFDPHIPEGSSLDGAENIRVDVVGHFRVLEDPRVLDAVVAAVEKPLPPLPPVTTSPPPIE
jgi:hypothetical protein